LLRGADDTSLRDHLAKESASISSLANTRDGAEGVAAFVDRRPADFEGR
jgi:enoyl-CoA hydratase/carnithine racemase